VNRIAIERAELGHCVNCGRPMVVGRLVIASSPYGFSVCRGCLDELCQEFDKQAKPVVNG
jgi:hypothetical protein